jgi:hypothetical protein
VAAVTRSRQGRRDERFLRNFGSIQYVEATRASRCIFCRGTNRVMTAHILRARGMGGAGGSVRDTGPCCFLCDLVWGQGSGQSPTRLAFLAGHRMTWEELEARIAAHHAKHGHLYEQEVLDGW